MAVSIRGYSERGLLNSLLYEIRYSNNSVDRLREVLCRSVFPNMTQAPNWDDIETAEIIVEQSFSKFGDLDALILLDGKQKQSVFIEAKVKTAQRTKWLIKTEWEEFNQHLKRIDEMGREDKKKRKSSNLFVQLYKKQNLVRDICRTRRSDEVDSVAKTWSIGVNKVVKRAVDQLKGYCAAPWFLALVPDKVENLASFFRNTLNNYPNTGGLPAWQGQRINRIGYLSWHDVRAFCRTNEQEWGDTLRCFDFNRELFDQIERTVGVPFPAGSLVKYTNEQGEEIVATVVRSRRDHTRIKLQDGTKELVSTGQLELWTG